MVDHNRGTEIATSRQTRQTDITRIQVLSFVESRTSKKISARTSLGNRKMGLYWFWEVRTKEVI